MAGFTPFTDNYTDLSDESGYQFEFRCDICGSGYRSEFIRSNLGTASTLLRGASGLLGGVLGSASNVADRAKDITDRGARDEALKKAANEIMPLFTRCPRCNRWVDETCWNEARGLCISDAPKLATEMEAERAQVEISQMREAMRTQTVFSGDTTARTTVCTNCGKPVGSERFCSNCGQPTGQAKCTGCGNDLPPGARFCGNCGTAVA
ncbi:MAG: zinc ribbon domain-containing protein [Chloroflexi bacterium]|nr:zinc ribbon domain-containing protein [Chloroflexota bacterium]